MDRLHRALSPSTMCFVKAVPKVVETLNSNNNFCVICRESFQANDTITILGCCKQQYHIECVSKWFNTPLPGQRNQRQRQPAVYVTCMLCKARWCRRMFNAHFPPSNLTAFHHLRFGGGLIARIEAGAPPADSSLMQAAAGYGRFGLQLLVGEMLGSPHEPVKAEDVPRLMNALMERVHDRMGNLPVQSA